MSFGLLGTVCLLVYLVLLVGLAEYARRSRKDSTPSDHFLAGRELGFFVLLLTLYATTYSGNSLLGYPGEGYRRGYAWIISTGMMMSLMVGYQILIFYIQITQHLWNLIVENYDAHLQFVQ